VCRAVSLEAADPRSSPEVSSIDVFVRNAVVNTAAQQHVAKTTIKYELSGLLREQGYSERVAGSE